MTKPLALYRVAGNHELRRLPGAQARRFGCQYKKLDDNVAADVDQAVEVVAKNLKVGEQKKGDLVQLWVYKFRSQGLLGYALDDDIRLVYLEAVGYMKISILS